jgi:hypothetical protein
MKRGFRVLKVFKFLFFGTLFVGLAGFVVMSLWNWLIPSLFAGPVVTFWQALGLLILCKILFGGFHKHGRHNGGWQNRHRWKEHMRHRMANMTPEQREKFRQRFARRCGWDENWNENPSNETK